ERRVPLGVASSAHPTNKTAHRTGSVVPRHARIWDSRTVRAFNRDSPRQFHFSSFVFDESHDIDTQSCPRVANPSRPPGSLADEVIEEKCYVPERKSVVSAL